MSFSVVSQFGKISSMEDMPDDAELEKLIAAAAHLASTSKPPKRVAKPPPIPIPEFAAALDDAPKSKAVYDGFTDAQRRDYCDWIADAKREATRDKRIATAIEWLAEGKRKNWKYENC